jgi:hypothetical protein
MKERFAALGSLLASALLSFCCTIPLALASLGLGALGLGSVLRPWRPVLLAVSAALLGAGFIVVHRRRSADRKNRILLWIAAAAFVVTTAAPPLLRPGTVAPGPGERVAVVELEARPDGCPSGCEGHASLALRSLPGVLRVAVDLERGEATLILRAGADLDADDVARVLRAVGHRGRLR